MSSEFKTILSDKHYSRHTYAVELIQYENKKLSETLLETYEKNDAIITLNYVTKIKLLLVKCFINIKNKYQVSDSLNEILTALKKLALSYLMSYKTQEMPEQEENFYRIFSLILHLQTFYNNTQVIMRGSEYTLWDNIISDIFLQLELGLYPKDDNEKPDQITLLKKFHLLRETKLYTEATQTAAQLLPALKKSIREPLKSLASKITKIKNKISQNYGKSAEFKQIVKHLFDLVKLDKKTEALQLMAYAQNNAPEEMYANLRLLFGIILFKINAIPEAQHMLKTMSQPLFTVLTVFIESIPLQKALLDKYRIRAKSELIALLTETLGALEIEEPALLLCPTMHHATQSLHQHCFSELVAHKKGTIDDLDEKGYSLLHQAASAGNEQHVIFLLKNKACYDLPTKGKKHTALHLAVLGGHLRCVQHLVEAGADILKKNANQKSALDYAKELSPKEKHPIYILFTKKTARVEETLSAVVIKETLPLPSPGIIRNSVSKSLFCSFFAPTAKPTPADITPYAQPLPECILSLRDSVSAQGYRLWMVGGAIRDCLLGKQPRDYDFVTDMPLAHIMEHFPHHTVSGSHYQSITLTLNELCCDITPLNQLQKNNITTALWESCLSRDFTINALCWDMTSNVIIDFFNGMGDIHTRTLRSIGDPKKRFTEDPLRILRGIRIAEKLQLTLSAPLLSLVPYFNDDLYSIALIRLEREYKKWLSDFDETRIIEIMQKFNIQDVINNRLLLNPQNTREFRLQ